MDVSPLFLAPSPMLAFYRLLVLRSGNAGSLAALCSRDVLSTRSRVRAGRLLAAPHVAGFDRPARKQNSRHVFSPPSRLI